ncbi:hypothetical protein AKJ16_DCAP09687 [Drosera capensis]
MAAALLGSLTAAFHLGSAAASNSPDQLKTRGLRFGFVGLPRRRSGLQDMAMRMPTIIRSPSHLENPEKFTSMDFKR